MMVKYGLSKMYRGLRLSMCYLLLLQTCYFIACNSDSNEAATVVSDWIGKKIVFPSNIPCTRLGEPVPCEPQTSIYKVLLYIDSIGCTSCDLRIDEWKKIISESQSNSLKKLSFHFYFNPRKGEDLSDLFKRENFKEQVYIDKDDLLNKENKFLTQMTFQCFLLNEKDEVVLVGNPTLNSNIRKIYLDLIHNKFTPGQTKE